MSKIIIYENLKTHRRGYMGVPHSYESDWSTKYKELSNYNSKIENPKS